MKLTPELYNNSTRIHKEAEEESKYCMRIFRSFRRTANSEVESVCGFCIANRNWLEIVARQSRVESQTMRHFIKRFVLSFSVLESESRYLSFPRFGCLQFAYYL